MTNEKSFELKQTLSPVLFQPVIGLLVSIPLLFAEFKHYGLNLFAWDWGFISLYFIGGALLCWSWARTVRQYRVFYRDDVVGMRPAGAKADIIIPVEKIESVQKEFSLVTGRAPRRIAFYTHNPDGSLKYVDVSLKHFVAEDIRKLLDIIHKKRPDLELPKV